MTFPSLPLRLSCLSPQMTGCLIFLLSFLLLGSTWQARAATLTVTNTDNSGPGSLRDAINNAVGGDTINITATGTVLLMAPLLTLNKDLIINGPGANLLTISGEDNGTVFTINVGVVATISGVTITKGNVTGVNGGGIFNAGTLTLLNCTINQNTAACGGGVYNEAGAILLVEGSTFSSNTGGSTNAFGGLAPVLQRRQPLVASLGAQLVGGGIANLGTATVINSTFSANIAPGGGGIYNGVGGLLTLTYGTLTNNLATDPLLGGGGILNAGTVTIKNTLIAGNTDPTMPDVSGAFMSQGFNLIGNGNGSTGFVNGASADQVGANGALLNPLLGPLAYNGGPTQTHALLAGSPALDKGGPVAFALPRDQRGSLRIIDQPTIPAAAGGNQSDIGAYEAPPPPPDLTVLVADPIVCNTAGGLLSVTAYLTNPNTSAQAANFVATLQPQLTALAGTCTAFVNGNNVGGCTIAAGGGSVTWNGNLTPGQTVVISYQIQIAANAPAGGAYCATSVGAIFGVQRTVQECVSLTCPLTGLLPLTTARVSDQKPGSLLAFPYFTSRLAEQKDTRLTLSNIGEQRVQVHVFLLDGASCAPADFFLCLTPNASFAFRASEYDPETTGYLLAVAVDSEGRPITYNGLIGNAFVRDGEYVDNYGAEAFWRYDLALTNISNGFALLGLNGTQYDAAPVQFSVEIQSPQDAVGQKIVLAPLAGDLSGVANLSSALPSLTTAAAQIGTGVVANEREQTASFSSFFTGGCLRTGLVTTASPRVPGGLQSLLPSGRAGSLRFRVGGGVGLLLTPRTAGNRWHGMRLLHKVATGNVILAIPVFPPVC